MPLTRRHLLELLSSSTFFLTVSPGSVIATELAAQITPDAVPLQFPQGVASGDPQPNGIMLWTRAVPANGVDGQVKVLLQMSTNSGFSTLVLQEEVQANPDADYTVRSYIDGLTPDTQYFYRFLGTMDSVSRIGRTRTAPSAEQARKVKLAFVSCQSYEQGYYGSWARMLEDDFAAAENDRIHFVLHLGDFIYERCWNEFPDGSPQSRTVPPFPNGVNTPENRYAVSLADYRHLYKTYLGDPHLQAARANWPFICTWDDHEFANDGYQSFTTYSDPALLDAPRKLNANQAWFEFIPAVLDELKDQQAYNFRPQTLAGDDAAKNQAAVDSLRIYRKLSWGKLLDIVLTDCRSYRSPACLPDGFSTTLDLPLNTVELVAIADAGNAYNDGQPPQFLPYGDGTVLNPARDRAPGTMLGATQREWFLNTLKTSNAPWKLWGNSLPLMPLRLDMSALPFTEYEDSVFNIDGWAGFPYELGVIAQRLEDDKVGGLVSLSGDHHMHGAGTVPRSTTDIAAMPVAVDFTVAGISSAPLYEDLLAVAKADHPDFAPLVYSETEAGIEPTWNISMLYGVFAAYTYSKTGMMSASRWLGPNLANPGLMYVDTTANGYGLATLDSEEMKVQLVTVSDCRKDFVQPPAIHHRARFRLPLWHAPDSPQLAGPEFDGIPPFPFDAPAV